VILLNADDRPAEPPLVQKVAARIEELRPIGAAVTVVAAAPVIIDVSATLVSSGDVQTAVEAALSAYLKRTAFAAEYVSAAHVGAAILGAAGVLDFSNLTVNGGAENIPLGAEEVAVLGVVAIDS
jgi:uncharacterized phage protein gp47/JayE